MDTRYEEDKRLVEQLLAELKDMCVRDEGDDNEVVGMFVMVQRKNQKIYPHAAGAIDHARMLGIALPILTDLVTDKVIRPWTVECISRSKLEGGV